MKSLRAKVLTVLGQRLGHFAIPDCAAWAEKYRYISGLPWSFSQSPWTRELHNCKEEYIVAMKSAQMGFTEAALNRALYDIDQHAKSVLYIMPTDYVASDFSTSRFDPILQDSPHLKNLFGDVHNIQQKRAGNATLYMRGSNSRSKLKSISTPDVIFDELDEMAEPLVRLAEERASGQAERMIMYISTPTIEGFGISSKFDLSTQDEYTFACPSCGRRQQLVFPDSLVIVGDDPNSVRIKESHLICLHCKSMLPHETKSEWLGKGEWVSAHPGSLMRGFHINQLYSIRLQPWNIARDALLAETNPYIEQELFNSKLGMPHVTAGARLTQQDIDDCIGTHNMVPKRFSSGTRVCMGVDVNKLLNVEITEYTAAGARVLKVCETPDFTDLDTFMLQYRVDCCVIDNMPETRKALEFAKRWPGLVYLCVYNTNTAGKEITKSELEKRIVVNRSVWIDTAFARIFGKGIEFPQDLPPAYKKHLTNMVRVYKLDKNGNPYTVYIHKESEPDHYAHSRTYCEVAFNAIAVQATEAMVIERG